MNPRGSDAARATSLLVPAAGPGPDDAAVALLAARLRGALLAAVVSNVLFALADLRLAGGLGWQMLGLKGVQVGAAALVLVALPRLRSRRAITVAGVAAAAVVVTMIAIAGAATGYTGRVAVLCVGTVVGAAMWIPWGTAAQVVLAVAAAAAMLLHLELSDLGLAAMWNPEGLAVGAGLVVSVGMAAALRRQRRAVEILAAERAAAVAALHGSVAELQAIFASLDDVFCRADLAGRILVVSPAVARYGYAVEDLVHGDVGRLYRDAGEGPGYLDLLLEHGSLRDFELVLLAKDGRPVPVSANLRLLRDVHGEPTGVEAMLRDIRERKRVEAQLRSAFDRLDERVRERTADLETANARLREASAAASEAEHRFRTVSRLTSDYAYCFRLMPDGTSVTEWSTAESFERVTGYTTAEIAALGGGLALVHPDDLSIALARIRTLVDGERDVSEFRIVRKDGEVRWIREHGDPERDEAGAVTRIYGAAQDVTERKRAEQQLADVVRQRENVLRTVPDVIYSIDASGRLLDWSHRLEVVTGMDSATIAATPAFDFFVPEDRARIGEAMARGFTEGYAEVEARLLTSRGPRLYQYSGVPLRDDSGAVVGLTGVGRDVSELRDAERRTAALLDVARDVSGTLDVDEILDRIQRRAADLVRSDTVTTFCWDDVHGAFRVRSHFGVPPELAPQAEALAFPLGVPFDGELAGGKSIVVDDVTSIPAVAAIVGKGRLIAAPLRARGRYLGALIAMRSGDSAPFEPAEIALCEGIALQLALSLEGAALYRTQQEEATISAAAARVGHELIAALDGPDLLGQLCKVTVDALACDASHTRFLQRDRDGFVAVASHGYPPETWERIRLLDIPTSWAAEAWRDGDGAVRRLAPADLASLPRALVDAGSLEHALLMPLFRGAELIGLHVACHVQPAREFTSVDARIGERIGQLASLVLDHARAVQATNEASRLKSEFVATMSHELRTPLNVIVGYHEMLLEGAFGEIAPAQREALRRADRSARGLLALISDTLDLSRLEASHAAFETTEVSLADLARELVAEAGDWGGKDEVRISSEVPEDLPRLHTDAGKLRVVLKNLLGNALKFTERGFVRVTAGSSGDAVEICVEDSGSGIPPEALEYIFEPFRQGDGSSTRQHEGVGLGLYIVRRLLDVVGGSIAVDSKVGVGTTFRVRLPIRVIGSLAA